MLGLLSWSHRKRNAAFEQWQAGIDETLKRAAVVEALGPLAVQLRELNEGAFLPNVRHNTVEVPKQYLYTERVAMLPRLPRDGYFLTGDTLLQPTPDRRAKILAQLGQADPLITDSKADTFINESQQQHSAEERHSLVNTDFALGGCHAVYDEKKKIFVAGRPLVSIHWGEIKDRTDRRATGVHEMVHAYDSINAMGDAGGLFGKTHTEVRAYRAGAIVLEDAVQMGEIESVGDDTVTYEVEQWREQAGIDATEVLTDSFTLDPENMAHDRLVLDMMIYGRIRWY